MSAVCNQLRRLWQTKGLPTPTRTKATRPPSPKNLTGLKNLAIDVLFKEPDAEIMANKFKMLSSRYAFRCKYSVYTYAIDRLAKHKRFSAIEDILELHKKYPEMNTERYAARLISLYGISGMFQHAHKLFDELPQLQCERNAMAFSALLVAGVNSKEFQRVVEIFHEYPAELGFKPDALSYYCVIRALGEQGLVDEAISMVDQMEMGGLEPNVRIFYAVVSGAYGKKGFKEGERVWKLMLEKKGDLVPNIKSYNAKLQAMVGEGMMVEAVDLFDRFDELEIEPDAYTYDHLIKGFCDIGDLGEARNWYRKLVEARVHPTGVTFETLIRPLCEDGDSELALDLSRRMLGRSCVLGEDLLQMVVDALVKSCKHEEAEKLVESARSNVFCQYNLVMP